MNIYIFGKETGYKQNHEVKAKSFEMALNIFKVECLFPEYCVDRSFIISQDYDSALERNIYELKPDPQISVYWIKEGTEKRKFLKKISLSEVTSTEYGTMLPIKRLPGPQIIEEESSTEVISYSQLIPGIPNKELSDFNKSEIRAAHDLIKKKMYDLEQQRHELADALNKMREELDKKCKILYVLETYMGLKEEIVQLLEGQPVSEEEPVSVYQMKLFMDEEIGLWEDGGIDITKIEIFDDWIKKNYKRFLYKEKSICAWQVRRNEKDYGDVWINIQMEAVNKVTYFLIRNGENLYRIWSDVRIGERFFPRQDEYEKILNEHDGAFFESNKKNVQKLHENYLYGLIALQGLIERTNIFGTKLRHVNLMVPNGFTEKEINLIRDDEPGHWITEGHLCWDEYIKQNRSSMALGTRVVTCIGGWEWYRGDDRRNTDWRSAPYHPMGTPDRGEIYQIEEVIEQKNPWGVEFKIYYQPGDEIWNGNSFHFEPRKRRVPFQVYRDELLNYDEITIEDCEYYESNRFERRDYLRILPIIHHVKKLKQKEKELEDHFIRFLQGAYFKDMEAEKIRPYLRWWKLKNMWKRELTSEDAKAVRMIVGKIKSEQ